MQAKQVWVRLLDLGEPSSHAVLGVLTRILLWQMSGSFGEIMVGQDIVGHYLKSRSVLLSLVFFVCIDLSHLSLEQRRPKLRMLGELVLWLLRLALLLPPLFRIFANALLLRLLANSFHLLLEVE